MSVLMGYNGGGPGGGGGGGGVGGSGAGGGPSGDHHHHHHLLYQDPGCAFQESPLGLVGGGPADHHLKLDPSSPGHLVVDHHSLGYGSDLDSLAGSSSSSHLPYSPEPEAPLFSDSLDYGGGGMPGGNNNNNESAEGGVAGGGGGGMGLGLGEMSGGGVGGGGIGIVGGGGGGGGGRPRRRRRTPPKAKIDINDNSLYSVYCIFKSILSASTASTVAIDNKIEQAMDLVKSHLMFAVREEVEVLKEKISELMERINQLEYENTVLRQYATQEALQQLQQPHHSSNT